MGNVSSHSQQSKTNSDINLDWDDGFKDAYLADLDVLGLGTGTQHENPFAFGN
jgi:hypothetical protein